ncbi:hypothetical protein AVEN_95993-2-1, partial [Araneus ventricosus]
CSGRHCYRLLRHTVLPKQMVFKLSGCPPLDLKVRTDVVTSQHIQGIKHFHEIGGLQSFDFKMARKP